jgi:hypothetical protein
MNVSIKFESEEKQTWAVYVESTCIARGLRRAEANRVRTQVLNGELRPRLS